MIKKKICMLGAFAVGKTSLVQRYVHSLFSDKYHTTVGVKIEKAQVRLENTDVDLIIWDLHGEDEFQHVRLSYLKGSSGCIYVADGTRKTTLATALNLKEIVENTIGKIPFILVVNKLDLRDQWEIDPLTLEDIREKGTIVIQTSAKTGDEVKEVFQLLTKKMMDK
ncbi:MAG: GTP-binding protein [Desulfobacula sp.]|uniref:Rab family GTPase n=1 Tax=Desulfobacula sp. TaxID=2593537 RepID=UPI0025BF1247|nr:Rab family GTPase [Desulfobacula sp.]MCD4719136.1 GTP-binding protein [Desulfobacula sp.]